MDLKDFDWSLDINGASKHLGTDKKYNERNYGFGISGEKEDNNLVKMVTAGGYKNSFGNPSYYAGAGLARRFQKGDYYADLGGIAGGVTGYDKTVNPLAALMLSLGKKEKAKLNFLYAPKTPKSPSLVMMNLGIPFK